MIHCNHSLHNVKAAIKVDMVPRIECAHPSARRNVIVHMYACVRINVYAWVLLRLPRPLRSKRLRKHRGNAKLCAAAITEAIGMVLVAVYDANLLGQQIMLKRKSRASSH